MKSIAVVVPVYREEEVIEFFHARLVAALTSLRDRYRHEICYVLDKSSDATERKLRDIARADDRTRVLVLSRRFGHQAALVAGIDLAGPTPSSCSTATCSTRPSSSRT
jgi:dolichol-phosphate mannosyltransferase